MTTSVTATDGGGATATVAGPELTLAVSGPPVGYFDFEDGPDSFVFAEDALGGPSSSDYVSGNAPAGFLQVELGGEDRDLITDMSGGWTTTFELTEAQEVTVDELVYRIAMAPSLDIGEIGDVILAIDSDQFVIRTLAAMDDDNIGEDTGFESIAAPISLGILDAGVHTLTLGGFLNQKTRPDEIATIQFEELQLAFADPDAVLF